MAVCTLNWCMCVLYMMYVGSYGCVHCIQVYVSVICDVCMFMGLCAHVCTSVHVCVCMFMWRLEVNVFYLSLIAFHLYFLRQHLSLNLSSMIHLGYMASELHRSTCFCFPQRWDYRHVVPCLTFYVGTRNSNSGAHACYQTLHQLSHLPKP